MAGPAGTARSYPGFLSAQASECALIMAVVPRAPMAPTPAVSAPGVDPGAGY